MKTPVASESRHHRLREAYRRELGTLGLFIEGTLCKVQRPGRKAPAWQLTFKQAGKTRTVYVPAELDRCTYDARHLWWQMLLTFLLRGGSRNAFDGDRNTGQMPANVARLCGRVWDEARLGARRTVTCSGNAVHHASRVAVCAVAEMPLLMTRRLMQMRLPDGGRLSGRWRLIAVDQTLRWTEDVPFGAHVLNVLFSGEISPKAATLWVWVTNLRLSRERVYAIANNGGRARSSVENVFNVEKNGGFGLEHTFCANEQASQNYHLMMQVAFILWQLLAKGVLHRLTQACRKVTDVKLVELLRTSLLCVSVTDDAPSFGQLRFSSA